MKNPEGYPYGVKSKQSGRVIAWFMIKMDRDICMDEVFTDYYGDVEWEAVDPEAEKEVEHAE